MTEAELNPLQTIVDQFKTLSPETPHALIFKANGEMEAKTKATTDEQKKAFIENFGSIASKAQSIGDIENITIHAANGQLCIDAMGSFYLATVSSRAANQEVVQSLTQVVVPLVVQLVDKPACVPAEDSTPTPLPVEAEETAAEEALPIEEELKVEPEPLPKPQPHFEPLPPRTPVNQLMVEKITGMFVQVDTVRINGEVIENWGEVYRDKKITHVCIEALDGKKTTCKFKPIKDAKSSVNGIIQIPEKILQTLRIEKGKLVIVKPVVE